MPFNRALAKPLSALTLVLAVLAAPALSTPARADDSALYGVENIDVSLSGPAPELTLRKVAGNHQLANLQLAVQENQIAVAISGYVDCTGVQFENWTFREGHFLSGGAFGIGHSSLLLSRSLPNSTDIDHESDLDAHTFQMPVALLANPQIDIDPVAVVLAAAEKAPSRIDYLRQDHTITVKFPIRWEALCASYTRNKVTKSTITEAAQPSHLTKDVELKIRYKGDPQLFAVNAQLAQGGGLPNQLQAGDQPLKITTMTFQPNMPNHVGACPATTKIRVFYQGQGKGQVRIRINDGGTTIHDSPAIAFDAADGPQHYDFEIQTPQASKFDLNKTFNHNMRVYLRAKDEQAQVWPAAYQPMDSALWKHRCTPQVNPAVGGLGGGKLGGFQSGGAGGATATPGRAVQPPVPVAPQPRPGRLLPPADGTPEPSTLRRAQ